jgi:hypothetical protein
MAPPQTYPKPHRQLGVLMVLARRRGLTFEEFWREAVRPGLPLVMTNTPEPPAGAVRWPSDRNDRVESEQAWRRAYNREPPTRAENALAFLADALDAWATLADELAEIEGAGVGEDDTDFAALMAAA